MASTDRARHLDGSTVLELVQSGFGQQFRDAAAGAKHPCHYGAGGNSNDLRDLCHRFLVVINRSMISLWIGESRDRHLRRTMLRLFSWTAASGSSALSTTSAAPSSS